MLIISQFIFVTAFSINDDNPVLVLLTFVFQLGLTSTQGTRGAIFKA